MSDVNRIKKELKECSKDALMEKEVVWASLVSEANLLEWIGKLKGPVGTPYEGGVFIVDISLPRDYPFVPPKMKFRTRVWHPNVSSQSGAICLDILKNEWSPALTIRTALISLQALLSAPEPDDPQDAEVAKQYKDQQQAFQQSGRVSATSRPGHTSASSRPQAFQQKARFWTETYAVESKCEADTVAEMARDSRDTAEMRPRCGRDGGAVEHTRVRRQHASLNAAGRDGLPGGAVQKRPQGGGGEQRGDLQLQPRTVATNGEMGER